MVHISRYGLLILHNPTIFHAAEIVEERKLAPRSIFGINRACIGKTPSLQLRHQSRLRRRPSPPTRLEKEIRLWRKEKWLGDRWSVVSDIHGGWIADRPFRAANATSLLRRDATLARCDIENFFSALSREYGSARWAYRRQPPQWSTSRRRESPAR